MDREPTAGNEGGRRTAVGALFVAVLFGLAFSRAGISRSLEPSVAGKPRILRVWDWWSPSTNEKFAAYFTETEREFERRHPDVDLVYQYVPFQQYEQKMATALVGNSPPDVFQSSVYFAEGFYDRGVLLPLNQLLERERAERQRRQRAGEPVDPGESVDQEQFLEAAWRHNTKPDGTVFGIPQILDANCLIWNLDLLRKEIDDPDVRALFVRQPDGSPDPQRLRFDGLRDWEHFRRVVRKLSHHDASGSLKLDAGGNPEQAGFALSAYGAGAGPFLPWCASNGSNFQDEAGTRATFADPAGVEAMQFLIDLYWKDKVSPPFRRQLSDFDVFLQGKVGCVVAGTWSGKYIVRDAEGRVRFDLTPFPPGPRGSGHTTLTWGNLLVITRRASDPDLAWEYVKFVTSRQGSLRLMRLTEQNSPRKDFYQTPEWTRNCEQYPYLSNVAAICASGKKLRNTQIIAVDHTVQPVFETLLLRYPQIEAGRGPYPSVREGMERAAEAVNRVYDRYNDQVAYWRSRGKIPGLRGGSAAGFIR